LPAHMGQKKYRRAGPGHVRPKTPPRVHQVRHGAGRQHGRCVGEREMEADCEPGQPARHRDGARRRWRSDHQARGGQDAFNMRGLDGPVDLVSKAEIIRRDDEKLQCAVSRRSRRKRKNSTPSRRRRFITSGLRAISPTIWAIFPGRK
jgi:hypothetical protein